MSADKPMEDEQTQPSTKGSTATNSPQAENHEDKSFSQPPARAHKSSASS